MGAAASGAEPPSPRPGWYANPTGSGQRYWDGERWAEGNGAKPSTSVRPPRSPRVPGLILAGYSCALVLPVIGIVLGIVVATRPDKQLSKHGYWIVILSVLVSAAWIGMLSWGGWNTVGTGY